MKNYQELREKLVESYKKEYPLDFEAYEPIDFEEYDDLEAMSQFLNNIGGNILDVTFDNIEDANESYCQASYYSETLKKTVIIDSNLNYDYATPDDLIDMMIEQEKEADRLEASLSDKEKPARQREQIKAELAEILDEPYFSRAMAIINKNLI